MKTIINQIKALLNFARMAAADLVQRATAIYVAMNGNVAFPKPPVDMVTFKAAIDGLSSAIPGALALPSDL